MRGMENIYDKLYVYKYLCLAGPVKEDKRSDISCTFCMAIMQLLDEAITDPTNEQQVIYHDHYILF